MQLTQADIDKNDTVQKCPICKGRGTILVKGENNIPTKNPNRKIGFTQARICICRVNELVENSSSYFNPKTTTQIADKVAEGFAKKYSYEKNLWFTGPSKTFMNICKAVFVHHRKNPSLVFHIANGLELLQNYYVEQTDGASRTLNDLINGRDLLVILCVTSVSNKALSNTVLQIVQSRELAGKGTWVYTPDDFQARTEYSEGLAKIIGAWTYVDLTVKGKAVSSVKPVAAPAKGSDLC